MRMPIDLEFETSDPVNAITSSWIQQAAIRSALRAGNEPLAVRFAISSGVRDENRLSDLVFYTRYPQQQGKKLMRGDPLIPKWLEIRDRVVRPVLRAPAVPGRPAAPTPAPTAPSSQSTTSGVEADGNTVSIIQCIRGLQDQGRSISFVVRYLRDLRSAEVTALSNASLRIVSCYEMTGASGVSPTNMAYFTRAQGQHDGQLGFTQAQAVGQSAETPVYFAVDTDPGNSQRQAILNYAQGLQDGYNQYRAAMQSKNKSAVAYAIGMYGSGCVLDWCRMQGIVTWFWQAFAPGWCNNRQVWPGANIHTSGRDIPARCGWRLGRLEGWGNEGGW